MPEKLLVCTSVALTMKPRATEAPRRSRNVQGEGPNWILVAGSALLSTLSIRFGYKLKQVLDAKQLNSSSPSLKEVFGEALTSRRIDPVSLDHINVCNEWLIGEVVNDDDVGKDLIFEGETLDWQTAHVASGTGEPESRTRSTPGKRKEPSTDVSYAARARATTTKKDTSTSTSRSNRIEQQVEEEVDDINDVGSEEPALEDDDLVDESSEGEEEEGYASLDDQEVD